MIGISLRPVPTRVGTDLASSRYLIIVSSHGDHATTTATLAQRSAFVQPRKKPLRLCTFSQSLSGFCLSGLPPEKTGNGETPHTHSILYLQIPLSIRWGEKLGTGRLLTATNLPPADRIWANDGPSLSSTSSKTLGPDQVMPYPNMGLGNQR